VAKPSLMATRPLNWSKCQSYLSPVVGQSTRAPQQAEACTGATSICLYADILCPYGDTSSRKVWCNSPNKHRRYKRKYTRFLANFRTSGAKKLLGADPSLVTLYQLWTF